jgi:hypothetical protein
MTPQERRLIDELFDRLGQLESKPRDPEAENAIIEGLRRAPNAAYALVQTVLVQDEALRRANDRIEELQGGAAASQPSGGFLDSMREAVFGSGRGSVPSVRPGEPASRPVWNSGQALNHAPDPRFGGQAGPAPSFGGGSSFLGTAAAAAAGVIGGSLLMNSIRGLTGGSHQAFGDSGGLGSGAGPWGGTDSSSGDLARDAGVNDIGRSMGDRQQGLYDRAATEDAGRNDMANYDDDAPDDGGFIDDGDDSDFA